MDAPKTICPSISGVYSFKQGAFVPRKMPADLGIFWQWRQCVIWREGMGAPKGSEKGL